MRNTLFLLVITLLVGCSTGIDPTDIQNSPCACHYDGKPLNTTPNERDLKEIAELQFLEA